MTAREKCCDETALVVCGDCPRKLDLAFAKLTAIAREINPNLPADLSGHEIRITLSKDFQAVEAIDRSALAKLRGGP